MPKRVIDGDGLWRSDKLAQVQPPTMRAEYANLIPLALSNGVFEASPRRIWSTVYSYNREDVSLEYVENILAEFERVKLLFRWHDASTGKVWGYWVGIEKPGRLPGKSRRGTNEAVGPQPPQDALLQFVNGAIASLHGIQAETNGIREESTTPDKTTAEKTQAADSATDSNGIQTEANGIHRATNGCLGLGFGSGLGSGNGGELHSNLELNTTEAAGKGMVVWHMAGMDSRQTILEILDQIVAEKGMTPEAAMDWLIAEREAFEASSDYRKTEPRYRLGVPGWLKKGVWASWRGTKSKPSPKRDPWQLEHERNEAQLRSMREAERAN